MSTLILWHNRFSENENEAVEAHIHDIKIPRRKSHDIEKRRQSTHGIVIPTHFSDDKKPRHRGSKAEKPRHRDCKTKKPSHRVGVEF